MVVSTSGGVTRNPQSPSNHHSERNGGVVVSRQTSPGFLREHQRHRAASDAGTARVEPVRRLGQPSLCRENLPRQLWNLYQTHCTGVRESHRRATSTRSPVDTGGPSEKPSSFAALCAYENRGGQCHLFSDLPPPRGLSAADRRSLTTAPGTRQTAPQRSAYLRGTSARRDPSSH